MSARLILRLLLAFALAFAGSAAQLHALSHAQSDLAAMGGERGPKARAPLDKAPAPLKHATDQCLVVHALDATAAEPGAVRVESDATHQSVSFASVRSGESPAAAFQSRAPPALS